jgi:hypothetical protein
MCLSIGEILGFCREQTILRRGGAIACLNLFMALAVVSMGLLLGLSVSLAALLCDRTREPQPIRLKADRKGPR